mgnify:CR=1 FL=1
MLVFNISEKEFLAEAKSGLVFPLMSTLTTSDIGPLYLYQKLSSGQSSSFLLESAEQGVWSRYSFIGIGARSEIRFNNSWEMQIVDGERLLPNKSASSGTMLDALESVCSAWRQAEIANLPPLASGLVGLIGWDLIREIEKLPSRKLPGYEAPIMHMQLVSELVVVDHLEQNLKIISNIYCDGSSDLRDSYQLAVSKILEISELIESSDDEAFESESKAVDAVVTSNLSQVQFVEMVEKSKDFVIAGDVFQVVVSQRFDVDVQASGVDVYRELRSINPSPYMYLLNFVDESGPYAVVGSSPEALVTVSNSKVTMHPIAGTRPRGESAELDAQLAAELEVDAKERAEHLMLVDLARNDLLKVCTPNSVEVEEFMQIHNFSHVMHLVSTVTGQLAQEKNAVDVLKATFPAGTLSGAPKPRALEIIEELEPQNRGIFGGVVGYFNFAGDADLAIAIRTALIRNGKAHVQAGAGIVLDSVPEMEFQETINKASAVIRASSAANGLAAN